MVRLLYGVGVNDADYVTQSKRIVGHKPDGRRIYKTLWTCPFYRSWANMMTRCYNKSALERCKTYQPCSVAEEWHRFSAFKEWMQLQDWKGKSLDKDLLVPGNKVYGPEFCVFISSRVNTFLIERQSERGPYPIGVYYNKRDKRFIAQCNCVDSDGKKIIGRYHSADEAHDAWVGYKLEQARLLAAIQDDPRVAKALIARYENYVDFNR